MTHIKLSIIERESIDLLEKFCVMKVGNLFKYEGGLDKLNDFLGIVMFMSFVLIFVISF